MSDYFYLNVLVLLWLPCLGGLLVLLAGRRLGVRGCLRLQWVMLGLILLVAGGLFYSVNLSGDETALRRVVWEWFESGVLAFEFGLLVDSLSTTLVMLVMLIACWHCGFSYSDRAMMSSVAVRMLVFYQFGWLFLLFWLLFASNMIQLLVIFQGVELLFWFWLLRMRQVVYRTRAFWQLFVMGRLADVLLLLAIVLVVQHFATIDFRQLLNWLSLENASVVFTLPGTSLQLRVLETIALLWLAGILLKMCLLMGNRWGWSASKMVDGELGLVRQEGQENLGGEMYDGLFGMVIAVGLYGLIRMISLFEFSEGGLSMVMWLGAVWALWMAMRGLRQDDIWQVLRCGALSQLGFVLVAIGLSAYAVGLLFFVGQWFAIVLLAGSVAVLEHSLRVDRRDFVGRKTLLFFGLMGVLVGGLSIIGLPGLFGFFGYQAIFQSIHHAQLIQQGYWRVLLYTLVFAQIITIGYVGRFWLLLYRYGCSLQQHDKKGLSDSVKLSSKSNSQDDRKVILQYAVAIKGGAIFLLIGFMVVGGYGLVDWWLFTNYFMDVLPVASTFQKEYYSMWEISPLFKDYQNAFDFLRQSWWSVESSVVMACLVLGGLLFFGVNLNIKSRMKSKSANNQEGQSNQDDQDSQNNDLQYKPHPQHERLMGGLMGRSMRKSMRKSMRFSFFRGGNFVRQRWVKGVQGISIGLNNWVEQRLLAYVLHERVVAVFSTLSSLNSRWHKGLLNHYAFAMAIGILIMLLWLFVRQLGAVK